MRVIWDSTEKLAAEMIKLWLFSFFYFGLPTLLFFFSHFKSRDRPLTFGSQRRQGQ